MRGVWACAVAVLLASGVCRANGRPAASTSIAFAHNPQRIIAGVTFGALVSEDGGITWHLICEDPLGTAGVIADPVFRDSPTGMLLVGSTQGYLYSRDGGCSYARGGGSIAMQSVADLAISPIDPMRVLAATSTTGAANGIHVSNDGGATFAAPATQLANTSFGGVAFASDGQRAYALAVQTMTGALIVQRSEDGATFNAVGSPAPGLVAPRLFGVSPLDKNTFYFSVVTASSDALYVSTNGGMTLQLIADGLPAIYGGTIAADGAVYLATNSGVRKLSPGGATLGPPPAGSPPITCLGLHGGALFGCSTENASGFALGRSTDGGQTWTPIVRFSQDIAGPLQCAEQTDVCTQCYPKWKTFAMQFNISNVTAPACTSAGGGDAASPPPDGGHPAGGGSSGCGCTVGAAEVAFPTMALLLLLALPLSRRSR